MTDLTLDRAHPRASDRTFLQRYGVLSGAAIALLIAALGWLWGTAQTFARQDALTDKVAVLAGAVDKLSDRLETQGKAVSRIEGYLDPTAPGRVTVLKN